jgi:transcriptional regulator with XRE-family HTH domain
MAPVKKPIHRRQAHHLRQWRIFRELTQDVAADRVGVDRSTLAKIELGQVPYNQDILERLAFAYGCEVSDLLTMDPLKPNAPRLVYDRLRQAPQSLQERALLVLDALLKAG